MFQYSQYWSLYIIKLINFDENTNFDFNNKYGQILLLFLNIITYTTFFTISQEPLIHAF